MLGLLVAFTYYAEAGLRDIRRGIAGVSSNAGNATAVRVEVGNFDAHVAVALKGEVR